MSELYQLARQVLKHLGRVDLGDVVSDRAMRYARYAGFADLDALFYVRVHLAQTFPAATIRGFYPASTTTPTPTA